MAETPIPPAPSAEAVAPESAPAPAPLPPVPAEPVTPEPPAPEADSDPVSEAGVSGPEESTIVEETLLFDPPAPEVPDEPVAPDVASAPSPVPMAPPPAASGTAYEPLSAPETELAPPPAVPITQPIRVNPKPSHLPPAREDSGAGELPRLDVNLAENAEPGPDSLVRNPAPADGPVKVQLSPPGTETERFSPDDFVVPAGQQEISQDSPVDPAAVSAGEPLPGSANEVYEAPVDPPVETYDEPSYEAAIAETAPVQEEGYGEPAGMPLDEIETLAPAGASPESAASHSYAPLELPPLGGEPVPAHQPAAAAADAYVENPVAEEADGQEFLSQSPVEDPDTGGGLDSGSFESLLAEQSGNPAPGAAQPAADGLPVETGNSPREAAVSAASASNPGDPVKSERDVLDEMFGGGARGKGNTKKSTVMLLSILGATAIVAIIGVAILIKAMGGLTVSHGENTPPPAAAAENTQTSKVENTRVPASPVGGEPSIDDAPAVIDPVAQRREEGAPATRSTVTLPGEMEQPVRIVDSSQPAPSTEGLSATEAARTLPPQPASTEGAPSVSETPALSFDERVQQIVNGNSGTPGSGASVIGGAPSDPVESALEDFGKSMPAEASSALESVGAGIGEKAAEAAKPKAAANYNPPPSFPAPGPDDGPLGKTHDLLDAFLRAPDWETRVKYTYQGESLRPTMEEYYKKWDVTTYDRFSLQLFQMEEDEEMGGPYWVFLVSTSDVDQGFPVIIRVENGLLKVDWEIYSEFEDRHFVQFQKGAIASPHSFRLVVERVSDYYGSDRDGFENLDDYYVYQVNPPYGDLNEFSNYAFVKADSEIARSLDEVVGLGEQPLAVIVTLSQEGFPHGVKHLVITEYVTEGWFR